MNPSFEIITSLQYSLKAATAQVEAFKSGKKYLDMQKAHCETVTVRNQWFEVFEDLGKLEKTEEKINILLLELYKLWYSYTQSEFITEGIK